MQREICKDPSNQQHNEEILKSFALQAHGKEDDGSFNCKQDEFADIRLVFINGDSGPGSIQELDQVEKDEKRKQPYLSR
ncbi:MAG TPA: hypothetical protein VN150_04850, partial [Ochrobactrum sp.]|nr:hypothetical protein [Ochrobactrum sp.]